MIYEPSLFKFFKINVCPKIKPCIYYDKFIKINKNNINIIIILQIYILNYLKFTTLILFFTIEIHLFS